jgi:hypothetical protein
MTKSVHMKAKNLQKQFGIAKRKKKLTNPRIYSA